MTELGCPSRQWYLGGFTIKFFSGVFFLSIPFLPNGFYDVGGTLATRALVDLAE